MKCLSLLDSLRDIGWVESLLLVALGFFGIVLPLALLIILFAH
jgi:hypothetical protein